MPALAVGGGEDRLAVDAEERPQVGGQAFLPLYVPSIGGRVAPMEFAGVPP